jgi:hypothetical protein
VPAAAGFSLTALGVVRILSTLWAGIAQW